MSFYPVMPPDVTPGCAEDAGLGLLGQAGVIAVRVADLACPARRGLGRDGRTALTAAGAGRIRSGDLVAWLKPVAVAPAVVRRDGRVQAAGHPADHARLGVAEERLDELCGIPGAIDQIARSVVLGGRVKGAARRAMTPALAIRFTVLMTLIPDADYTEVMATLLGDLVLVPWQRPFRVPAAAVACTWREALGPAPLERLRDLALAGVDGEHRSHDYRAVTAGDLEAGSIDGSLIRVPDSPANRAAFGSAGTADDSSPFPQLRELRISAASTRATFGVVTGPAGAGGARDKGEAEQVLLDKALKDYRYLFTPWRLWVMDRNFPGVPRIKAMLEAGTHVLIRVRDGITLRRAGDFLPDGSYLAEISDGGITLTVRVIEYTVTVAGRDAPELFCLITDLHDHAAYPARQLAQAYHWRWIGSETALKEAKSAITGAGPSTGPMLRSASPPLIRQEHAACFASDFVRQEREKTPSQQTACHTSLEADHDVGSERELRHRQAEAAPGAVGEVRDLRIRADRAGHPAGSRHQVEGRPVHRHAHLPGRQARGAGRAVGVGARPARHDGGGGGTGGGPGGDRAAARHGHRAGGGAAPAPGKSGWD
jgi:hypothetical protein